MAGLGYKVFTAGEVLTAANVQGYLQDQVVQVFAGTAARGSAIGTALSEGMVTYLQDSDSIEFWNGSAWQNINDNTASVPLNTVEAAGDLIVANGSASVTRLAAGLNGYVLSSTGTALQWIAPTSGEGAVTYVIEPLQVISIGTAGFIAGNRYFANSDSGTTGQVVLNFVDSGGSVIASQSSVENAYFTYPSDVAEFYVQNTSTGTRVLSISDLEPTTPSATKLYQIITSTQDVVLNRTYEAHLIGGGGAGGGVSTAGDRGGGGGGGSGYYTFGTITAGTYTATIGAGGLGVSAAAGNDGGATTIGTLTANGGSGGQPCVSRAIGGAGGNGGSGGAGGAATASGVTTDNATSFSGALGNNGAAGTSLSGGTAGAGGTGSGAAIPNPIKVLSFTLSDPADVGVSTTSSKGDGGGVFAGGGGGGVSTSTSVGNNATGRGGGGGGARGDESTPSNIDGGDGDPGIIILVEV